MVKAPAFFYRLVDEDAERHLSEDVMPAPQPVPMSMTMSMPAPVTAPAGSTAC
jgi:hypothetical protein